VFSWVGFEDALDNCTDAKCFDLISLTGVHYSILKSLWTTAPVFVLDFVGLSSVEPMLFKP